MVSPPTNEKAGGAESRGLDARGGGLRSACSPARRMAKKEKGAKPQQAEKKKAKSQSGALLYAAAAAAVAIGAVWMASRGPLAPSSPPNPAAATSRPGRPPSPSGPDGGKRAVSECTDNSPACQQWANLGECEKNPKFMHVECTKTCGACKGTKVERQCQDDNADCERWALTGQCVKNSEFMMANCRKSCGVCGPFGPACERKGAAAITPGDIKTTFERAVADFPQYSPEVLHTDPWVVRFDNFVSDEEADRIIELCQEAFQRSLAGDQVSPVRTSTQCWCNFPKCLQDPMLMAVEQRVANLTRVPVTNGEFMQVVRYDEGQFCASPAHDARAAHHGPLLMRVRVRTRLPAHPPPALAFLRQGAPRPELGIVEPTGGARLHLLHVPERRRGGRRDRVQQARPQGSPKEGLCYPVAVRARQRPERHRAGHLPRSAPRRQRAQVRRQPVVAHARLPHAVVPPLSFHDEEHRGVS